MIQEEASYGYTHKIHRHITVYHLHANAERQKKQDQNIHDSQPCLIFFIPMQNTHITIYNRTQEYCNINPVKLLPMINILRINKKYPPAKHCYNLKYRMKYQYRYRKPLFFHLSICICSSYTYTRRCTKLNHFCKSMNSDKRCRCTVCFLPMYSQTLAMKTIRHTIMISCFFFSGIRRFVITSANVIIRINTVIETVIVYKSIISTYLFS